ATAVGKRIESWPVTTISHLFWSAGSGTWVRVSSGGNAFYVLKNGAIIEGSAASSGDVDLETGQLKAVVEWNVPRLVSGWVVLAEAIDVTAHLALAVLLITAGIMVLSGGAGGVRLHVVYAALAILLLLYSASVGMWF